jgi:hypothetical protein
VPEIIVSEPLDVGNSKARGGSELRGGGSGLVDRVVARSKPCRCIRRQNHCRQRETLGGQRKRGKEEDEREKDQGREEREVVREKGRVRENKHVKDGVIARVIMHA